MLPRMIGTMALLTCARGVAVPRAGEEQSVHPPIQPAAGAILTVSMVLGSPSLTGQTVQVRGRCLGYGGGTAFGGPPRTRSDWQLADSADAIYVAGPRPTDCDATAGSRRVLVVRAMVVEDTVRGLGGARPRRYLVVTTSP